MFVVFRTFYLTLRIRVSIRQKRASLYYYGKKIKISMYLDQVKIKILIKISTMYIMGLKVSMYTMGKLPPLSPNFIYGGLIRTAI